MQNTEEYTFADAKTGRRVTITIDHSKDALLIPAGLATLQDRYLLPGETPQKLFARVACAFSHNQEHAQRMYDYISSLWFMPATPVLSNGGTDRGFSISCFLNAVDDSLEGISSTWHENVWLAAKGGGIGTYWGEVRSKGEKVGQVGESSGIIPFIKVMDSATLAISQGSLRRGSAAVYLDVSHPEIEEFLELRKPTGGDPNRRSLNLHHGVNITDEFMEAVLKDGDFDLKSPKTGEVMKTIKARALFIKIMTMRLELGEPYIVFIDTANKKVPLLYKELGLKVRQSNLCSEIALHTGLDYLNRKRTAVCCLGSLNVETTDAWFGNKQFIKDVLYFLDNVLSDFIVKTLNKPGFENARYSASMERSIGLGFMGFHSYLQSKMIPFESEEAQKENVRVVRWVDTTSRQVNFEAAKELGACNDYRELLERKPETKLQPVRWANTSAIAPTASISIICGGTSATIEPSPANSFLQKTLSGSFSIKNKYIDAIIRERLATKYAPDSEDFEIAVNEMWSQITTQGGSVQSINLFTEEEKKVFKTAFEIDQKYVVKMAADRAPYITQMSSNNLFIKADIDKKSLLDYHIQAWKMGVPSLYYVRSLSLQRAEVVSHVAGDLPEAREHQDFVLTPIDTSNPEICESCQ